MEAEVVSLSQYVSVCVQSKQVRFTTPFSFSHVIKNPVFSQRKLLCVCAQSEGTVRQSGKQVDRQRKRRDDERVKKTGRPDLNFLRSGDTERSGQGEGTRG